MRINEGRSMVTLILTPRSKVKIISRST